MPHGYREYVCMYSVLCSVLLIFPHYMVREFCGIIVKTPLGKVKIEVTLEYEAEAQGSCYCTAKMNAMEEAWGW